MNWNDSMVRSRFVAIVVALGLFGAGCTHATTADHTSAPPQPLTSASPSPTPNGPLTSASPSPTPNGPLSTGPGVLPGEKPPVLSDGAKQHTPTGALLLAAYYFKAFDWSIATNDPFLVRQISAASCTACQRAITGIASVGHGGGHLLGGRISLQSSKLVTGSFRVKSDYVVQVALKQEAEVIVHPSASPSTVAPSTNDTSLVFVSWVGGGWQVAEVGAPS